MAWPSFISLWRFCVYEYFTFSPYLWSYSGEGHIVKFFKLVVPCIIIHIK